VRVLCAQQTESESDGGSQQGPASSAGGPQVSAAVVAAAVAAAAAAGSPGAGGAGTGVAAGGAAPGTQPAPGAPAVAGAQGTVVDPSKNQPKRLHVSNIPFRFRDPDLRAMFGVSTAM
jgi:hypothetical protein